MSDEHEVEYTESYIDVIELAWGDGFLSPGGEDEIALFLEGLDITGKEMLDVGSGTGGCDIVLVRNHGAGHALGIDVEQPVLDRSIARAERESLADRISYRKVKPGPFPLDDESFDVVFSKDAMIHIEDKHSLFAEVYRVPRPGGVFVASDWMRSDEELPGPEMQRWLKVVELTFGMHSLPYYADALEQAGFENITTRERNEFLVEVVRRDYELLTGAGREDLGRRGSEDAEHYIEVWGALKEVAEMGELRPGHIRGFKPAG